MGKIRIQCEVLDHAERYYEEALAEGKTVTFKILNANELERERELNTP